MPFLRSIFFYSSLVLFHNPASADITGQQAWDRVLPQYKLDALTEGLNDSVQGPAAFYAEDYAWQASYWVRALVTMADVYNDGKYLNKASSIIDSMLANRDDERVGRGELSANGNTYTKAPLSTLKGLTAVPPCWRRIREDSNRGNITACDVLIDGQIVQSILRFADRVKRQPEFSDYQSKADAYVRKAKETIDAWNDSFAYDYYNDGKIPGSYYWLNKNRLDRLDGPIPFNQNAVMAAALLLLDDYLGGGTEYHNMAAAIAAYWKQHRFPSNGVSVWNYDPNNPGLDIEDVNHGHMDLAFLVLAYKHGILSADDMSSVAVLFTDRIYQNDKRIATQINGNDIVDINPGGAENFAVDTGYDWLDLCEFDPSVFDKVEQIYKVNYPTPTWSRPFLGWANILRWRKLLGRS